MPKLFPCTITLVEEGKPAAGIEIFLYSKGEKIPWSINGITDDNGKAVLRSHGKFRGVARGTYSVVLSKRVEENPSQQEAATDDIYQNVVNKKPIQVFSLVDLKYTQKETTSLEITVEKRTDQKFELGPPVRSLLETIPANL